MIIAQLLGEMTPTWSSLRHDMLARLGRLRFVKHNDMCREKNWLTEGRKLGLPLQGTAPEIMSKQKSAGLSFGGSSNPREVK